MKCIECLHADLQAFPAYSARGFSNCKKRPNRHEFESMTFERDCKLFERAAQAAIDKRTKWNDSKK